MDNETLKGLASHIGSEIREQVGVAHDRIDELAADVSALPEVQHGRDGKHGEPGERGEKGDPGEAIVGPQGEQGPAGESIVGPQGEQGEKGEPGDSIVGPQGERGEKGDPGESIEGPQGNEGVQGEKGEQGNPGTGVDVPFWSSDEVYREGVEVQHHFGQFFRATKDTAESPDDLESWERVGSSGFRLTGPFSKEAEYRDGDLYVKDFGLFLHSSGKSTLIAGRGPEGKKGKPGATGRDGKDGADGQDGQHGADGSLIDALELRGANLVAVFKDADGTVKDHSVSLEPFLTTAALVTKEAAETEKKSIIDEADQYVRKLWNSLSQHLDAEDATPISFYRGIWRMDVSYQVGDWVRYGAEGLLCKRAHSGVVPHNYPTSTVDSSEYWQPITGQPTHGVNSAGDDSGGGSGVTPLDVLVKEGGQGGTKFSQFPSTSGEGITGVGVAGGQNVQFALTTDAISVNPNPFRNSKNGQFIGTPEELAALKNQRDVNEFLYGAISDIESGDIDLEGYATEEWVEDQLGELPPGTVVSDTAPEDPEEGQCWYDTVRLELFVFAEDAWLPCSPLGARVEQGEAVQAQIIDQIQESLVEQQTLKNKVSALEGAIGEHSLLFTSTNQNPREGEFNLKNSEYRTVTYLSEAGFITLNGTDRDGNTINLSRIVVGDVLRLSDISRQVAELQVTQITDGNIFTFENLSGDLERFSEGPYDFILLSAFDPAGLATISYVDERDGTKLGKAANNVIDNNFRISRSDGAIYWNTSGGDLTLSRLKTPTSSHHAVNKAYVDEALMEQAYISARPPGVKFQYQPGSSDLNEMSFQWFQSDSRLRISAKGVDIDWLADGFTHDYSMSNGPYFTIWYMPSIANVNDRPQWKVRKHGRIDRIDWHKDDILCYISSSKSNANFSDGATYYITIGGIL